MKLKSLIKEIIISVLKDEEDYRGEHSAPTKGDASSPLFDLTDMYGDDIYSSNAARYYGDGYSYDILAFSLVNMARNKPNFKVKIYRAVPKILTNDEKINKLKGDLAYIQKNGKLPKDITTYENRSEYYEFASNEIERLSKLPKDKDVKLEINKGDWITILLQYAKDHGKNELNNDYRILTKTVYAKDIYNKGESIMEWGYDPQ